MTRIVGVYTITCLPTGKVYVGQSVNVRKRFQQHKELLQKGQAHNAYLQHAWEKHGAHNFVFNIVEVVSDVERLTEAEQRWHDELSRRGVGLFNFRKCVDSNVGSKRRLETVALMRQRGYARFVTEEARTRVSQRARGSTTPIVFIDPQGSRHETQNITAFAEKHGLCRRAMAAVAAGKYQSYKGWTALDNPPRYKFLTPTQWDALCARYRAGEFIQPLADEYGVDASRISDVLTKRGIPRHKRLPSKQAKASRVEVVQLWSGGASARQIRQQLGVSTATVYRWLEEAGLRIQQKRTKKMAFDKTGVAPLITTNTSVVTCPECGRVYSNVMDRCPECDAPKPEG